MTNSILADMVEKVARAINGPHCTPPLDSRSSLEELRDVRWSWLTPQEQGQARFAAQAAIRTLAPMILDIAAGECRDGLGSMRTQQAILSLKGQFQ